MSTEEEKAAAQEFVKKLRKAQAGRSIRKCEGIEGFLAGVAWAASRGTARDEGWIPIDVPDSIPLEVKYRSNIDGRICTGPAIYDGERFYVEDRAANFDFESESVTHWRPRPAPPATTGASGGGAE